jgi:hypothetical protein
MMWFGPSGTNKLVILAGRTSQINLLWQKTFEAKSLMDYELAAAALNPSQFSSIMARTSPPTSLADIVGP